MRIISNFHDYYDVVMATDQDREVIFHREQSKEFVQKDNDGYVHFEYLHRNEFHNIEIKPFIIGFYDKIYPSIELQIDSPDYHII